MHLDVASGGELHVALSAGVRAERLVLHGNNKSTEELATALEHGVGRIVVDSFDEIARLGGLIESGPPAADAAPGARAGHARRRGAHPRVRAHRPGGLEVRLLCLVRRGRRGRRRARADARRRARRGARPHRQPGLRRLLLRAGGRGPRRVLRPARAARARRGWRARRPLRQRRVGADADANGPRPRAAPAPRRGSTRRTRISAEPGRSIVATAGITLYTVGHGQAPSGDPHLRERRRRHERQPAPRPLRQRVRGLPPACRFGAGGRGPCVWWASTARAATSSCPTPSCRTTSRWATSWPRRSPAPTATPWLRTTTRCRARRSSSCPTARPAWWSAARPSRTSSELDA